MIQFYLILVWVVVSQTGANDQKTPLTRCCKDGEFYRLGLDRCLYQTHDLEPGSSSPVLYAVGDNDTMLVSADEFQISYNLVPCPKGYVATTTTEFQVFVDGKLLVAESLLKPDQFCISQIPTLDPANPEFVARYCVPDPCVEDNLKCLRKCCPPGLAVDIGTHSCQPDSTPFNVSEWIKINGPKEMSEEGSITFHTGLGFECNDDDIVEVEDFIIAFDEKKSNHEMMHSNLDDSDDRPTDQYCIDNFIEGNTTKFMGLRCMSSVKPLPSIPDSVKKMMDIHPYLLLVAAFFLLAAFVTYASLPNFRNKTTISVMCHLLSLAVYNIGMAVLKLVPVLPKEICLSLPVLIHFASLSAFSWLNILCFDLWWSWRTLKADHRNTSRIQSRKPLVFYSLYGWGIPLIIVAVSQVFQYAEALSKYAIRPDFHLEPRCWFSTTNRLPLFAYLYGPVTILFLGNILFFVLVAIAMCKGSKNRDANRRPILGACTITGVFLLMGGLWMTESITFLTKESFVTWLVTDILHVASGILIFILFVCNQAVAHALTASCQNSGRRQMYTPEPSNKRPNPRALKKMTSRTASEDSQQTRSSQASSDGKRRSTSLPDKARAHYNASRLDSILMGQENLAMPLGYRTVDSREWHQA